MRFERKLPINILALVLDIVFAVLLVFALTQQYVKYIDMMFHKQRFQIFLNDHESILVVNFHHL